MAGNLCSIMALTTGRGGRQPEGPRRKHREPSPWKPARNVKCQNCLINFPREILSPSAPDRCPWCGRTWAKKEN